jgi:rhamnulokinase
MPARALRIAVDLGAGSGRVVVGRLDGHGVELEEVHRFQYPPRRRDGRLRWDMAALIGGLEAGLVSARELAAARGARLASVGVDSWGVDYGLLDTDGRLLEEPVCYRDERTDGVMERVFASVPRSVVFARTGIQFLKFNTLYQLVAHREALPAGTARLLMIPDLCHHLLCASEVGERTNASTTQLLNAASGLWDEDLMAVLRLPRELMPAVVPAGTRLGRVGDRLPVVGLPGLEVIAPATHDTASAVAGTPLGPGWAYVSSGTWSLVGVERDAPLLSEAVADANFTNEAGAYGTVRFLKNVMGLWLLESCRKEWDAAGLGIDLDDLLRAVAGVPEFVGFVFPDDERFFSPPSMVRALSSALEETGQRATQDPVRLARVILDSLALRYASVVRTIEGLTGQAVPGIHVVGGGSRNDYLNQATADAAGRTVLAGPVEATAVGNLLVQSITGGDLPSLAEGRRCLVRALRPRRFEPGDGPAWAEATRRYAEIESAALAGLGRAG